MTAKRKFRRGKHVYGVPHGYCSLVPLLAAGLLGSVQAQTTTHNGVTVTLPGANTLPSAAPNFVYSGSGTQSVSGNTMTINQSSQTLGLNWNSFNIGQNATVNFVQPDGTSRVLNRIHDLNPSVIAGRLNANGQVYMLNSNGILFTGTAQVNVGGLLASSLNIGNELLEKGLPGVKGDKLVFNWDGDNSKLLQGYGFVAVDAGARIKTADGGKVILLAPASVQNLGLIEVDKSNNTSAAAEAILAAGGKVVLTAPDDPGLRGLLVEASSIQVKNSLGNDVTVTGKVVNRGSGDDGHIDMGRGTVSLAALAVNQEGRINASQAVNLNGQIMLVAGKQSTDRLTVTQVGDKAEIDWKSGFGIYDESTGKTGIKAGQTIEFMQSGSGSVAYNFINDADRVAVDGSLMNVAGRTAIDGTLKANGQLFLINEKGIEFGANARVSAGSLVASGLGLNPLVLSGGLFGMTDPSKPSLQFFSDEMNAGSDHAAAMAAFKEASITVQDGAQIGTGENGFVILAGSRVDQAGLISTPKGQAVLAAGAKVYLSPPYSQAVRGFGTEVDPLLYVNNGVKVALRDSDVHSINQSGTIQAQLGNITLVGHTIDHSGKLLASTSATANGSIRLLARDNVSGVFQRALDDNGLVKPYAPSLTTNESPQMVVGTEGGGLTMRAGSRVDIAVDGSGKEMVTESQGFLPSSIEALAARVNIEGDNSGKSGAQIVAPGGKVSVVAAETFGETLAFGVDGITPTGAPSTATVFVGSGAKIDVSGSAAQRSVKDLFVKVELRGDELANNPVQRNGELRGETVTVDVRDAVKIADLSGYINQMGQTVEERTAIGGDIAIRSSGSLVVQKDAVLDVSGGRVDYAAATVTETKISTPGGQLYRLNDAPVDLPVGGLVDTSRNEVAYTEGKSAGSVELTGNNLAVGGTLKASTVRGERQRVMGDPTTNRNAIPLGGKLIVRDGGQHYLPTDNTSDAADAAYAQAQMVFIKGVSTSTDGLNFGDSVGPRLELSESLVGNGFSRFDLKSDGRIEVGQGIQLNLGAGGEFVAKGRQLEVAGSIVAPGGKIDLSTTRPGSAPNDLLPQHMTLTVASGALLSTAGTWVNDYITPNLAQRGPLNITGGSVKLNSAHDLHVQSGSIIDVSGGAQVKSDGKLVAGDAGSITLGVMLPEQADTAALMVLEGELQGYSLGKGGTLEVSGPQIRFGEAYKASDLALDNVDRAALGLDGVVLNSNFLSQGGFFNHVLNGDEGVVVGPNVTLQARPLSWSLDGVGGYQYLASGTKIASIAALRDIGANLRAAPTSLTLSGASVFLDTGSRLAVDAGGKVSIATNTRTNANGSSPNSGQITVLGTIEALGGEISMTRTTGLSALRYDPAQQSRSIYLGENSKLLAGGTVKLSADTERLLALGASAGQLMDRGLYRGQVLNGGKVTLDAGLGYVITRDGSLIDVSGTTQTLNMPSGSGSNYLPTRIASGGGQVTLAAAEGMFLDGSFKAAGGSGATGGSFALRLGRETTQWEPGPPAPPSGPRAVVLFDSKGATTPQWPGAMDTAAYLAGTENIDVATHNGIARVDASKLSSAGFGSVSLQSQDRIGFEGDVSLSVANQIRLDSPNYYAASDATRVALNAAAVQLGNFTNQTRPDPDNPGKPMLAAAAPTAGAAQITVNARNIGLTGHSAWSGFGTTNLISRGEIYFDSAVYKLKNDLSADVAYFDGSYKSTGTWNLIGARLSPSSFSTFTVDMGEGSSSAINISRPGNAETLAPQLAAAGSLTFKADDIVHAGTIEAPLGEVRFISKNGNVTLKSNSITSVAGVQNMLLGQTTQSGSLWEYLASSNGVSESFTVKAPSKRVVIDAKNAVIETGAVINLSGGGEAVAWEFVPGPNGKTDILEAVSNGEQTVFAIVPSWGGSFAPSDNQNQANYDGSLKAGDQIQLDNNALGLSGRYTLLPARYALLKGAVLVTIKSGTVINSSTTQRDGAVLTTGVRVAANADGSYSASNQSKVTVELADSSVIAGRAKYNLTKASNFFYDTAGAQLPGDAGRLSVAGRTSLAFDPTIIAQRAASIVNGKQSRAGRGAELDLASEKLEVTDSGTASSGSGWTTLNKEKLNQLGVSSLMLGGMRTNDGAITRVETVAQEVRVATSGNAEADALQAPEIVLTAADRVTVESGSHVGARDDELAPAVSYALKGDGAFVRVASGAQAGLSRSDTLRAGGDTIINAGASLSGKALMVDATHDNQLLGNLSLNNLGQPASSGGALSIGAGRINIIGDNSMPNEGMNIDNARLAAFSSADEIRLNSYSTLDFYGNALLGTAQTKSLVLSANGLAGHGAADTAATIAADSVRFENPNTGTSAFDADGLGKLTVNAKQVTFGTNASTDMRNAGTTGFKIDGFNDVTVNADTQIGFSGTGVSEVDGTLTLNAGRVVVATGSDQLVKSSGALMVSGGGNTESVTALGGKLALQGDGVTLSGRIVAPAGSIELNATGAGKHVTVLNGGVIAAEGVAVTFGDTTVHASGGTIKLASAQGNVDVQQGALLSVSGSSGGHAGQLELSAENGAVTVAAGTLRGSAGSQVTEGREGAIKVTAQSVEVNQIAAAVRESGLLDHFRGQWDIRRLNGDVVLTDTVTAHDVRLAADTGHVQIGADDGNGKIDASGKKGGQIELFAGANKNVILKAGSQLLANATEAITDADNAGTRGQGGSVFLGSSGETGAVVTEAGSTINVGAAVGSAARGGRLVLRAHESAATTDLDSLNIRHRANVVGASDVSAEFVRVFEATGLKSGTSSGLVRGVDTLNSLLRANSNVYDYDDAAKMANLRTLLGFGGSNQHVRAGVELTTTGDFSVPTNSADISLSGLKFLGEAGVLTIKADGNISLNKTISDGFSNATRTGSLDSSGDSWSYRLVAGAASGAANPLATNPSAAKGSIALANNVMLRTGNGHIDLAAAKDIRLTEKAAVYTAGINDIANGPAGFTSNFVGAALANRMTPTFGNAGGNISLTAGEHILMTKTLSNSNAADGRHPSEWLVRGGASVDTLWYTNMMSFQQGVGALGGGDVRVSAGGDIRNLEVAIPTNGRINVENGVSQLETAKINGGGDLIARAGGNVEGGLFYVESGKLRIEAGAAVSGNTALGLGNTNAQVEAGEGVALGDIFNPLSVKQAYVGSSGTPVSQGSPFYPYSMRIGTYGTDSNVVAFALNGDASLAGLGKYGKTSLSDVEFQSMAPSRVRVAALNGDVTVGKAFSQAPGADGQLDLLAANNVSITGAITQYDVSGERMPSLINPVKSGGDTKLTPSILLGINVARDAHASTFWHEMDLEPTRIIALGGNVTGGGGTNQSSFNEAVQIQAGQNVTDLSFTAQHIRPTDVSRVIADGNIGFSVLMGDSAKGKFQINGQGRIEVAAGGNVDLSTSFGIVTRGNAENPYLLEKGADVVVLAGAKAADYDGLATLLGSGAANGNAIGFVAKLAAYIDVHPGYRSGVRETDPSLALEQDLAALKAMPDELKAPFMRDRFFDALRSGGREAVASGGEAGYIKGRAAIAALFPDVSLSKGSIDFFYSQIKTEQGGDITLLAPTGSVTVGIANPSTSLSKAAADQGLFTIRGGNISAYAKDDFLVNQSRVFTLDGGNILAWADQGNIDAGSGAKTVNSTPPPTLVIRNGQIVLDTANSVAGSGIGALASRKTTPRSDLDLFAPQGAIDAGDAGLRSTGNTTLGATQVLNSANIVAGGAIAGAPQAAAAPPVVTAPTNPTTAAAADSMQADAVSAGRGQAQGVLTVEVLDGEPAGGALPSSNGDAEKSPSKKSSKDVAT